MLAILIAIFKYQKQLDIAGEVWKNTSGAIAWMTYTRNNLHIVSMKARNYETKEYRKKYPKNNTVKF
ncbi:MAG: hypothetical protein OCC45_06385 [Desulfotalea sp.]